MRTFSDWPDPPPGFVEADLVTHSGPVTRGSFVQTLVVTDIASGWTELAPLLAREQALLVDVLGEVRRRLPFPLLGFDTDNDTVFMNETVRDYCAVEKIEFTRCRPYRKSDQAHVEQKNGEFVRRMVGYRRSEGIAANMQTVKQAVELRTRLERHSRASAVGDCILGFNSGLPHSREPDCPRRLTPWPAASASG